MYVPCLASHALDFLFKFELFEMIFLEVCELYTVDDELNAMYSWMYWMQA